VYGSANRGGLRRRAAVGRRVYGDAWPCRLCLRCCRPRALVAVRPPAVQPTTAVIIALNTQVKYADRRRFHAFPLVEFLRRRHKATSTTAPSPTTTNTGTPSNVAAKKTLLQLAPGRSH